MKKSFYCLPGNKYVPVIFQKPSSWEYNKKQNNYVFMKEKVLNTLFLLLFLLKRKSFPNYAFTQDGETMGTIWRCV